MAELQQQGINLEAVDIGGGLGIAYKDEVIPQIADYAKLVQEFFGDKKNLYGTGPPHCWQYG